MTKNTARKARNVATPAPEVPEVPAHREESTITSLSSPLAAQLAAAEAAATADPGPVLPPTVGELIEAANKAAEATQVRSHRLNERVVQAHIEVSVWSAQKTNAEVSEEVAVSKGADTRAGKYIMQIVDKKALDRITGVATKARLDHYARTFPGFTSRGFRLLAVDGIDEHREKMNGYKAEFMAEVDRFVTKLPEVKETSRVSLGDMYRDDLFPSEDEVRNLFKFHIRYAPVPEASNWILDLDDESLSSMRLELQTNMAEVFQDAIKSTYNRVHVALIDMSKKLREYGPRMGKGKGFRDSMFENIRELAESLPRLNFSQDERILEMAKDIHDEFGLIDGRTARESDKARDRLADAADKIALKVAGWMGGL